MFISFEGIEGSGKTLQIERTHKYLILRGKRCLVTREPGGTPFGVAVREILLRAGEPQREPISELLLYLADRHQHIREVVEPALREGVIVICDRYHDATRAYQGAARRVPQDVIDGLTSILKIPEPDKTILLDLDPVIGLARARSRNEFTGSMCLEGRFEAEDLTFHRDVQKAYLALARRFPDRIHVVDAAGEPEDVFRRIQPLIEEWVIPYT